MALCTHNRQKWGRCSEVNITFVSLLTGVRPIFFFIYLLQANFRKKHVSRKLVRKGNENYFQSDYKSVYK